MPDTLERGYRLSRKHLTFIDNMVGESRYPSKVEVVRAAIDELIRVEGYQTIGRYKTR